MYPPIQSLVCFVKNWRSFVVVVVLGDLPSAQPGCRPEPRWKRSLCYPSLLLASNNTPYTHCAHRHTYAHTARFTCLNTHAHTLRWEIQKGGTGPKYSRTFIPFFTLLSLLLALFEPFFCFFCVMCFFLFLLTLLMFDFLCILLHLVDTFLHVLHANFAVEHIGLRHLHCTSCFHTKVTPSCWADRSATPSSRRGRGWKQHKITRFQGISSTN